MSEESRWLTPRSSAWWITPIDSSSLALPYTPDIDIRPRPTAETSIGERPSLRFSMGSSQANQGRTTIISRYAARENVVRPWFSKQIKILALLPFAHLEVETRDLGFL